MFELAPLIILFLSGILECCFNFFKCGKFGSYISSICFLLLMFFKRKNIDFTWFSIENLKFNFSFSFNNTALILCSVISLILSCLYLSREILLFDKYIERKFGILNIFIFFMCLAILSNNIFQFYISLESLGLISTFLVGLEKYSDKQSTKVYLFNKFSSLLFLCGITMIAIKTGSFEINKIKQAYMESSRIDLLFPSCLILISCFCKGAQMPFSYWLLDAVKANIFASILIHAGTIVAIGIIFITKFYFIFESFPILKQLMIAIGLYTSFWMSCCSLTNNNIKKIIACLTASSAGIMFISCGIGGYSLALLYFVCHAFFKSMLFLSFTYLISAMSGENNIIKYGGLAKLTPKISDMILVSFLFAAGFPFLSGFFAKLSFVETIELSEIKYISISNIFINIITIMAMVRMLLKSLYGKTQADEFTLSRSSVSENYNSTPFWILTFIALLGSFTIWSVYEWGDLHFGYGGLVYVRTTEDYTLESIFSVFQLIIAVTLIFVLNRFSSLNYRTSKFAYSLFKKNEIYEFFCNLIFKLTTKILHFLDILTKRLFYIINVNSICAIFYAGKNLIELHKNEFYFHVYWIILGIIFALITIAIGKV